jgi:hypothetical protein
MVARYLLANRRIHVLEQVCAIRLDEAGQASAVV